MAKNWIPKNLKKGALHRQLGVPEDEKIPVSMMEEAAKAGGKLGQRARFAMTMRHITADNSKIPPAHHFSKFMRDGKKKKRK